MLPAELLTGFASHPLKILDVQNLDAGVYCQRVQYGIHVAWQQV